MTSRLCRCALTLLLFTTARPIHAAAEDFRNHPPAPGPQPALHAPVAQKKVLPNGLTLLAISKRGLPLVAATVIVRSGSAQDPNGMDGLAGFVGEVLKMGTETRNAETLAAEVENRGASIDVDVDEDATTVSTTALTENFEPVLDVMADMLQHPKFDPQEIERVRNQRNATLAESKDDPRHAASKVFRRVLYGAHPYAHMALGEIDTVGKIDRDSLRSYYRQNFRPANTAVVVVGDLTTEAAFAAVEKRFAAWSGSGAPQTPPPSPSERPVQVTLVDKPGAPQSQLVIGELGVARDHPDYYALVMCNAILGGLFNSRINMNLREDKGYTYGARSSFSFMRARGPFLVTTGVRTNVTDLAIIEVLKEVDKIRKADVTADELQNAKSRYSLSLPGYFQTVDGIAGMTASLYLYDLPLDYFQQLPARINAVSIADVRRVADAHLHPDKLNIVVVGDRKKVEDGLRNLHRGTVTPRDPEGNML